MDAILEKRPVQGPLFDLGRMVVTPGALGAMKDWREAWGFLARHVGGDWGDVCEEDGEDNWRALAAGDRLLSSYRTKKGVKVWCISEADRSATTILLPDEY